MRWFGRETKTQVRVVAYLLVLEVACRLDQPGEHLQVRAVDFPPVQAGDYPRDQVGDFPPVQAADYLQGLVAVFLQGLVVECRPVQPRIWVTFHLG